MARRMAGPMFGGLLTLAFMTSLVLPALWVIWRTRQLRRGTLAASLARSRAEDDEWPRHSPAQSPEHVA